METSPSSIRLWKEWVLPRARVVCVPRSQIDIYVKRRQWIRNQPTQLQCTNLTGSPMFMNQPPMLMLEVHSRSVVLLGHSLVVATTISGSIYSDGCAENKTSRMKFYWFALGATSKGQREVRRRDTDSACISKFKRVFMSRCEKGAKLNPLETP